MDAARPRPNPKPWRVDRAYAWGLAADHLEACFAGDPSNVAAFIAKVIVPSLRLRAEAARPQQQRRLTPKQLALFVRIARAIDEEGRCPAIAELGRRGGVAAQATGEMIRAIEHKGWLRRGERPPPSQRWRPRGAILLTEFGERQWAALKLAADKDAKGAGSDDPADE